MPAGRAQPAVSLVIVNWNGERYLPLLMQAIRATGYPFHEIIVADDASLDASLLLLRHRHPEVRVLPSPVNAGPGAARNRGLRAATGEFVLFVDNDGLPFPDAIEPLVSALASNPAAAAAMPRIILKGPPEVIHCDGARTHYTGQMWLLNSHRPLDGPLDDATGITSLMATAILVRRQAALAIGGFAEEYFIYYEDHEFGTALFLQQGDLVSVKESRFHHLEGTKDLSFRTGREYPGRRAYLTARNRILFGLVALEGRTILLLSPVLAVHEIAQAAYSLSRGWLEHAWCGWMWNLGRLGRTLRRRDAFQSRRRRPDREMLAGGPMPIHPGLMAKGGAARWILRPLERVLDTLYRTLSPWLSG